MTLASASRSLTIAPFAASASCTGFLSMLWAIYQQQLDPLRDVLPWSNIFSTLLAALPVVVLFYLLVIQRWSAPRSGAAASLLAIIIAITVCKMPADMAGMSFLYGACFGLLPVGWTVFNAMLLYNI